MKRHDSTTVVIPTLNEETTLPDCLESVGIDAEVEIIVSDGGSRDKTLKIARDARGCGSQVVGPAGERLAQPGNGRAGGRVGAEGVQFGDVLGVGQQKGHAGCDDRWNT